MRRWVREAERDQGVRSGLTTDQWEELKALRRENRELRRANEILRKASAYFAVTFPAAQFELGLVVMEWMVEACRSAAGYQRMPAFERFLGGSRPAPVDV